MSRDDRSARDPHEGATAPWSLPLWFSTLSSPSAPNAPLSPRPASSSSSSSSGHSSDAPPAVGMRTEIDAPRRRGVPVIDRRYRRRLCRRGRCRPRPARECRSRDGDARASPRTAHCKQRPSGDGDHADADDHDPRQHAGLLDAAWSWLANASLALRSGRGRRHAPDASASQDSDDDAPAEAPRAQDEAVDLIGTMLPIEILSAIYARVHRDELDAAAETLAARGPLFSYFSPQVPTMPLTDFRIGDAGPGIGRLLCLSRAHHAAVASALTSRRAWPDRPFGPGGSVWAEGVACAPAPGLAPGDRSPFGLHPVLADQAWHGTCFGTALSLPRCWAGTTTRRLLAAAEANSPPPSLSRRDGATSSSQSAPSSCSSTTTTPTTMAEKESSSSSSRLSPDLLMRLLREPAWRAPCLVLTVEVPHRCAFARAHMGHIEPLTLTRTYLCPPGADDASLFTVGGLVDAVADFYGGSALTVREMHRIRAHARSIWRAYERRVLGPLWGGRGRRDGNGGRGGHDNDDDDDYPYEEAVRARGQNDDVLAVAIGPATRPNVPPAYTDAAERLGDERRFALWFSDRWLGEGGLPAGERTLTRQFADPERHGRPRLGDLGPVTFDQDADSAPRLVVKKFARGRRAGVRQLCVFFRPERRL